MMLLSFLMLLVPLSIANDPAVAGIPAALAFPLCSWYFAGLPSDANTPVVAISLLLLLVLDVPGGPSAIVALCGFAVCGHNLFVICRLKT
jgi:hypothetical protein